MSLTDILQYISQWGSDPGVSITIAIIFVWSFILRRSGFLQKENSILSKLSRVSPRASHTAVVISIFGVFLFLYGTYGTISLSQEPPLTIRDKPITPEVRALIWLFFADTLINTAATIFIFLAYLKQLCGAYRIIKRSFWRYLLWILYGFQMLITFIYAHWSASIFFDIAFDGIFNPSLLDDFAFYQLLPAVTVMFGILLLILLFMRSEDKKFTDIILLVSCCAIFIIMGLIARFVLLPYYDYTLYSSRF